MNRLSPLIVRDFEPVRAPLRRAARRRWIADGAAAAVAVPASALVLDSEPAAWLDNLKLFATGWIGGLIFFGTLFG